MGTVAITRSSARRDRLRAPAGAGPGALLAEVTGPRPGRKPAHGSVRAGHVRCTPVPWPPVLGAALKAPCPRGRCREQRPRRPCHERAVRRLFPRRVARGSAVGCGCRAPAVAGTPDAGPA
ncbi:hypothetical protein HBB16_05725 [Pseudonocardia sp. MCCB 268]|nr:hypothetical protein [Pseudonocardia cytotoxica]